MNITITDTGAAKSEAETLIAISEQLDSCNITINYLKNQLPTMWEGDANADLESILVDLEIVHNYYRDIIIKSLSELGSAIYAYAAATEVLANNGNSQTPTEIYNATKTQPSQNGIISKNINGDKVNLTYYYYNDDCGATTKTGSGFSTNDFNVNENGWYTKTVQHSDGTTGEYVVLAGPTNYKSMFNLPGVERKDNKEYFIYGDIINFSSGGKNYQGIVLDSCGQAMKENTTLFDIFVTGKNALNPTNKRGVESYEKVGHVEWSNRNLGKL